MSDIKDFSFARYLIKEGKISKDFEQTLSKIPLEDIIALKLEISSRMMKGKYYGSNIYYTLPAITRDAAIKYALSVCKTQVEVCMLLGISRFELKEILKKSMRHIYFIIENNRKIDVS